MKSYCKHVDITDKNFIKPFVRYCILRHYKRYDFRKFLAENDVNEKCYNEQLLQNHNYKCLNHPIKMICNKISGMIKNEDLSKLTPVKIKETYDKTCFKTREIGCECPLQQCLDFIAAGAAKELFNARIVPQQCASIKGRGQIYGIKMIQKWIQKDNKAIKFASKHNFKYSPICKYFVKLDIQKCYPSMKLEQFMKFFKKDCKNEKLCWLWESLLKTHRIDDKHRGFMIGALISQWAAQYLISFGYRYVMSLHKNNYKKQTKVSHMIIFMDDMLLTGSNRKELLYVVHKLQKYMLDNFGLKIKDNYQIKELTNQDPIDMMGFKIHRSGKISIRSRNFIKLRRILTKFYRNNNISYSQSKRLQSYKGFYKYSNHRTLDYKYKIINVFNVAGKVIGNSFKH